MMGWKGAGEFRASTLVLVLANLLPLIGVLAWDWSAFNVVALYWMENLIIGAITVLKMLTCNPDPEQLDLKGKLMEKLQEGRSRSRSTSSSRAISSGGDGGGDDAHDQAQLEQMEQQLEQLDQFSGKIGCANHGIKLFMIPFFIVHYGIFCAVHGVFVLVLLGGDKPMSGSIAGGPLEGGKDLVEQVIVGGGLWFVLALAASHLFSYFVNFIGKGEYRRTAVPLLMFAPYPRIVALHIAILFGAFAIMAFGSPLFLVLLLIIGKIAIDLGLHLRSHRKLEAEGKNEE